jgi:hypothetical protein
MALALILCGTGVSFAEDAPAPVPAPATVPAPAAPATPAPETPPAPPADAAKPAAPADSAKEAPADAPKAQAEGEAAKEAPKDAAKEAPKEAPAAEAKEAPAAADAARKDGLKLSLPETIPVCDRCEPYCLHGSVHVRTRFRADGDDQDWDLYEYLSLDWRDELARGWSGNVYGRLAQDLDGDGDNDGYYAFDSIDDTYDSWLTGRLYNAWVGYRFGSGAVDRVRLGRFEVLAGDSFLVDGGMVTFSCLGAGQWQFHAFGGLPAHLFSDDMEGHLIVGAGVEGRPWNGGEVRFDWVFVDDETEYYGSPQDNVFNLEVTQRIGQCVRLRGRYQQVDDTPWLVAGYADVFWTGIDASLRGHFLTVPAAQDDRVYDVDPYYSQVLELEPYWDAHLAFSKGIGDHVNGEVGASVRQLYDDSDEGEFNREFERAYATLSTFKWPSRGLGLSVTGEWWNVYDANDYATVTFDVDWKPSDCWHVTVGTDYSYYKYDLLTDSERVDDYGFYARAVYRPSPRWRVDLSARVDTDDYDTYLTLRAGVRFDF